MIVAVEMLDDHETIDAHVCVGDPTQCEVPAACDGEFPGDGGTIASPSTPVLVWTTARGLTYALCLPCLGDEAFYAARLVNACHEGHEMSFASPETLLDHIRDAH